MENIECLACGSKDDPERMYQTVDGHHICERCMLAHETEA